MNDLSEHVNHLEVLDLAARGCMSGRMADWPQLQPALHWAVQEIERLRAEVAKAKASAFGDMRESKHACPDCGGPVICDGICACKCLWCDYKLMTG